MRNAQMIAKRFHLANRVYQQKTLKAFKKYYINVARRLRARQADSVPREKSGKKNTKRLRLETKVEANFLMRKNAVTVKRKAQIIKYSRAERPRQDLMRPPQARKR
jgi:HD superfamily phosphohydrolase